MMASNKTTKPVDASTNSTPNKLESAQPITPQNPKRKRGPPLKKPHLSLETSSLTQDPQTPGAQSQASQSPVGTGESSKSNRPRRAAATKSVFDLDFPSKSPSPQAPRRLSAVSARHLPAAPASTKKPTSSQKKKLAEKKRPAEKRERISEKTPPVPNIVKLPSTPLSSSDEEAKPKKKGALASFKPLDPISPPSDVKTWETDEEADKTRGRRGNLGWKQREKDNERAVSLPVDMESDLSSLSSDLSERASSEAAPDTPSREPPAKKRRVLQLVDGDDEVAHDVHLKGEASQVDMKKNTSMALEMKLPTALSGIEKGQNEDKDAVAFVEVKEEAISEYAPMKHPEHTQTTEIKTVETTEDLAIGNPMPEECTQGSKTMTEDEMDLEKEDDHEADMGLLKTATVEALDVVDNTETLEVSPTGAKADYEGDQIPNINTTQNMAEAAAPPELEIKDSDSLAMADDELFPSPPQLNQPAEDVPQETLTQAVPVSIVFDENTGMDMDSNAEEGQSTRSGVGAEAPIVDFQIHPLTLSPMGNEGEDSDQAPVTIENQAQTDNKQSEPTDDSKIQPPTDIQNGEKNREEATTKVENTAIVEEEDEPKLPTYEMDMIDQSEENNADSVVIAITSSPPAHESEDEIMSGTIETNEPQEDMHKDEISVNQTKTTPESKTLDPISLSDETYVSSGIAAKQPTSPKPTIIDLESMDSPKALAVISLDDDSSDEDENEPVIPAQKQEDVVIEGPDTTDMGALTLEDDSSETNESDILQPTEIEDPEPTANCPAAVVLEEVGMEAIKASDIIETENVQRQEPVPEKEEPAQVAQKEGFEEEANVDIEVELISGDKMSRDIQEKAGVAVEEPDLKPADVQLTPLEQQVLTAHTEIETVELSPVNIVSKDTENEALAEVVKATIGLEMSSQPIEVNSSQTIETSRSHDNAPEVEVKEKEEIINNVDTTQPDATADENRMVEDVVDDNSDDNVVEASSEAVNADSDLKPNVQDSPSADEPKHEEEEEAKQPDANPESATSDQQDKHHQMEVDTEEQPTEDPVKDPLPPLRPEEDLGKECELSEDHISIYSASPGVESDDEFDNGRYTTTRGKGLRKRKGRDASKEELVDAVKGIIGNQDEVLTLPSLEPMWSAGDIVSGLLKGVTPTNDGKPDQSPKSAGRASDAETTALGSGAEYEQAIENFSSRNSEAEGDSTSESDDELSSGTESEIHDDVGMPPDFVNEDDEDDVLHLAPESKGPKTAGHMDLLWAAVEFSELNTAIRTAPMTRREVLNSRTYEMFGDGWERTPVADKLSSWVKPLSAKRKMEDVHYHETTLEIGDWDGQHLDQCPQCEEAFVPSTLLSRYRNSTRFPGCTKHGLPEATNGQPAKIRRINLRVKLPDGTYHKFTEHTAKSSTTSTEPSQFSPVMGKTVQDPHNLAPGYASDTSSDGLPYPYEYEGDSEEEIHEPLPVSKMFMDTTPVSVFQERIKNAIEQSYGMAYAEQANLVNAMQQLQTEYMEIETELARREHREPDSLRAADPYIVFEDKKEADLYNYKYDPAPTKQGMQDPDSQRTDSVYIGGRELRGRARFKGALTAVTKSPSGGKRVKATLANLAKTMEVRRGRPPKDRGIDTATTSQQPSRDVSPTPLPSPSTAAPPRRVGRPPKVRVPPPPLPPVSLVGSPVVKTPLRPGLRTRGTAAVAVTREPTPEVPVAPIVPVIGTEVESSEVELSTRAAARAAAKSNAKAVVKGTPKGTPKAAPKVIPKETPKASPKATPKIDTVTPKPKGKPGRPRKVPEVIPDLELSATPTTVAEQPIPPPQPVPAAVQSLSKRAPQLTNPSPLSQPHTPGSPGTPSRVVSLRVTERGGAAIGRILSTPSPVKLDTPLDASQFYSQAIPQMTLPASSFTPINVATPAFPPQPSSQPSPSPYQPATPQMPPDTSSTSTPTPGLPPAPIVPPRQYFGGKRNRRPGTEFINRGVQGHMSTVLPATPVTNRVTTAPYPIVNPTPFTPGLAGVATASPSPAMTSFAATGPTMQTISFAPQHQPDGSRRKRNASNMGVFKTKPKLSVFLPTLTPSTFHLRRNRACRVYSPEERAAAAAAAGEETAVPATQQSYEQSFQLAQGADSSRPSTASGTPMSGTPFRTTQDGFQTTPDVIVKTEEMSPASERSGDVEQQETPSRPTKPRGKTYKRPITADAGTEIPPTKEEEFKALSTGVDLGKRKRASTGQAGGPSKKRLSNGGTAYSTDDAQSPEETVATTNNEATPDVSGMHSVAVNPAAPASEANSHPPEVQDQDGMTSGNGNEQCGQSSGAQARQDSPNRDAQGLLAKSPTTVTAIEA